MDVRRYVRSEARSNYRADLPTFGASLRKVMEEEGYHIFGPIHAQRGRCCETHCNAPDQCLRTARASLVCRLPSLHSARSQCHSALK